jgi:hypothetical protein
MKKSIRAAAGEHKEEQQEARKKEERNIKKKGRLRVAKEGEKVKSTRSKPREGRSTWSKLPHGCTNQNQGCGEKNRKRMKREKKRARKRRKEKG